MTNWKNHVLGGFISTTILLVIMSFFIPLTLTFIGLSIIVSFVYSQLPDIDIQSSKIRSLATIFGVGLSFIELVFFHNSKVAIFSIGVVLIIWIMNWIKGFSHRGYFHSILFGILLSSLLIFYDYQLAVVGLVNYLTHLVLDRKK